MEKEIQSNETAEVAEVAEVAPAEESAGIQSKEGQEAEKKYSDEDVDRIIARKIAAERKRMQKLFNEEQQVSEIEMREKKVLLRELKADAKDALIEKGLPYSLADVLDYSDKESLIKSMDVVARAFNSAVEAGIKARLRGETPRRGGNYSGGPDDALRNAFRP